MRGASDVSSEEKYPNGSVGDCYSRDFSFLRAGRR